VLPTFSDGFIEEKCNGGLGNNPLREVDRYTPKMVGLLVLFATALALLVILLTAMLVREMRRPPRHTAAYALKRGMATDPGELGLEFQEWMLDRPDGAVLPVWEIVGAARHGPATAVFVHGWGHGRVDSLARVEPFRSLVDRIVMYDLRGHGDSRDCLSCLGDDEHLDLLALLERLGNGPFVLVGYSMGAVIAMKAALHARQNKRLTANQIAGIVAYAPYCDFHTSLRGRLGVVGYPRRPITDLAMLVHRIFGLIPSCLPETELRALDAPLLVIHGDDDAVAPIEDSRKIAAVAPRATLLEIPGATHVDVHRLSPEAHDSAVCEFIAHLPLGTSSEADAAIPDASPAR
jgi:hypothetical protein